MPINYTTGTDSEHKGNAMKRITIRIGLSLMVAAGWWVQKLPAQTPTEPLPPIVNQRACPAPAPTPIDSSSSPTSVRQWFKQVANNYGRCCSSDVNNPGCMGWRAEAQFVFGSCRYWFGEPCLPPAPPKR
jgi:hypothetical protein